MLNTVVTLEWSLGDFPKIERATRVSRGKNSCDRVDELSKNSKQRLALCSTNLEVLNYSPPRRRLLSLSAALEMSNAGVEGLGPVPEGAQPVAG